MAETNDTPAEQNVSPESPEQPAGEVQSEIKKDDRNMAMLCHLLAIFTGFLGPLIIWLVKKDDAPYVDDQGKEALNFQLTVLIALIASGFLFVICIGPFLMAGVWIANLVFCIMASIKASRGEPYRYPVSIRFVK
jgi:uncharacterized Tic20 family protein